MNKISLSSGCTFGSEQASLIRKHLKIFIYFLFCFLLFLFFPVFERAPLSTLFEGVCLTGCQSCQATLSHKHVTATSNIERTLPTPHRTPSSLQPPTPVHSLTEATHNPPPPRDSSRNKQKRDKRRPNSCMSLGGGGGGG